MIPRGVVLRAAAARLCTWCPAWNGALFGMKPLEVRRGLPFVVAAVEERERDGAGLNPANRDFRECCLFSSVVIHES
jgi:hypothetical protein